MFLYVYNLSTNMIVPSGSPFSEYLESIASLTNHSECETKIPTLDEVVDRFLEIHNFGVVGCREVISKGIYVAWGNKDYDNLTFSASIRSKFERYANKAIRFISSCTTMPGSNKNTINLPDEVHKVDITYKAEGRLNGRHTILQARLFGTEADSQITRHDKEVYWFVKDHQ